MIAMLEKQQKDSTQSTALSMLKQVAIRLVKGEAAMRLELWRQHNKRHISLQHQALIVQLALKQKDGLGQVAVSMLTQIMYRLVKGEAGMRLEIWRQHKKKDLVKRHHQMIEKIKRANKDKAGSSGMNLLAQVMIRITKGEVAMRIEIWRQRNRWNNKKMEKQERKKKQEDHEEKLKNTVLQHRNSTRETGLSRILVIFNQIAKGETGGRLTMWRHKARRHLKKKQERNIRDLVQQQSQWNREGALQRLAQVLTRISKGKRGLRFIVWRQRASRDIRARIVSSQAGVLEKSLLHATEEASNRYTTVISIVKQHLAEAKEKYAKSVVTMRIEIWRQQTKRHLTRVALHQRIAELLEENARIKGKAILDHPSASTSNPPPILENLIRNDLWEPRVSSVLPVVTPLSQVSAPMPVAPVAFPMEPPLHRMTPVVDHRDIELRNMVHEYHQHNSDRILHTAGNMMHPQAGAIIDAIAHAHQTAAR